MKVDAKWAWQDVYFDNCFSVHPKTKEPTPYNVLFLVHDDGTLWPNPITAGRYRNCTALPEGEPRSGYERRIAILSKYTDTPEEAHDKIFVDPFRF